MKKPVFVAATVFAVAALAAAAVASFRETRRPSAASSPRVAAGRAALAGRQRRWRLKLETRLRQREAAGATAEQVTAIIGDWVVTVSGASAAGYEVACELEHAHVTGSGFDGVKASDVDRLEQALGRRFWISYQADGAATRIHFPREMKDDVRNLLQLVATQTQLVRPAAPASQWTATERDGAGAYFTVYQELGQGEIIKRKLRYVAIDGPANPKAAPVSLRVEGAELRFVVDAEAQVDRIEGHEASYLDAGLGTPGLGIEITVRMDQARSGRAPELTGSLERARGGLDSQPIVTQSAPEDELRARYDAQLIRGVSLEQLVGKLRAGETGAQTRAVLEALLRQRPSAISGAVAYAREAGGAACKLVLHTLGAAGTAEAQAALCGIASEEHAPAPLRAAALGALVQTKRPTSMTISTLNLLLDAAEPDVRRQAHYMVGSAGHNSVETNPAAAARIEADLLQRYARCSGAACIDLLGALGNLATPGVVPPIERALQEAGADVRASAVRALRNVKDPAAYRLISLAMTADPAPSVRAAAVFAATFQPMGAFIEPLARAVESDPVDYVRSGAIDALAKHIDESTVIERALVVAATKDTKPGVRRLARQVLGPRAAGLDAGSTPRKL